MNSSYRWRLGFVLVLLWIITTLTPLVILPHGITYSGGVWRIDVAYYFLFGAYFPPSPYSDPSGWISGPNYLVIIMMILLFFIIYAIQVTIYCFKPKEQRWAILSGLLSLFIPGVFVGFGILNEVNIASAGIYVGPLPFQFILGVFAMRLAKPDQAIPERAQPNKESTWLENEIE
ncbi:MAG: hypothetical protein ACFFFK_04160 [Candidatus Thorarchaeota archaeon]